MRLIVAASMMMVCSSAHSQSWIENGGLYDWSSRKRSDAVILTPTSLKPEAIETIVDASYLSKLVYGKQNYQQTTIDRGWTPIASNFDELPGRNDKSGFGTALYKSGDKYILAFRGSEPPRGNLNDWTTNLIQLMAGPEHAKQYALAAQTLAYVLQKYLILFLLIIFISDN